jgi:hypothetical protein
MFTHLTIISTALTALFIKWDKDTQFTHPTLHFLALAGMFGVVYSVVTAA